MNLVLRSNETALAARSQELLAKECAKGVKLMDRIGLATMAIDTRVAELEELARRCKASPDGGKFAVDFTAPLKATQLQGLILLYEAVKKERKRMLEVGVDDAAALSELDAMRAFAERLGGQSSLFAAPDDDEDDHRDEDEG